MAKVVKLKHEPQPTKPASAESIDDDDDEQEPEPEKKRPVKKTTRTPQKPTVKIDRKKVLKEGAAELGAVLKADISKWTKFSRLFTTKKRIPCLDCDGTGKVVCSTCNGTGRSSLVVDDQPHPCSGCGGAGKYSCVMCLGKGTVKNQRRGLMQGLRIALAAVVILAILQVVLIFMDSKPAKDGKTQQNSGQSVGKSTDSAIGKPGNTTPPGTGVDASNPSTNSPSNAVGAPQQPMGSTQPANSPYPNAGGTMSGPRGIAPTNREFPGSR